jgi:hypothetical protein
MNYGSGYFFLRAKKRPSKIKWSLEGAVPRGIAPHEETALKYK